MKISAFVLCILVLLSAPTLIRAQTAENSQDILSSGILLNTNPQFPTPGENVSATLQSSTIDLNIAIITWKLNGVKVESGVGDTSFSFAAPLNGSASVSVDIGSSEGSFTKSFTITPGSVDLLWQGDGYTPPFYRGKTLWSHQSTLTLFAVPHVGKDPSTLVYRWSLDGDVVGSSSGTGKSSFSFTGSLLRQPRTVKLDIMADRNTTLTSTSITLSSYDPSLLVYEKNPLYGIFFNNELGNGFSATNKEFSFVSIPLFFSTASREESSLQYNWQASGGSIGTGSNVTYRTPEGTSGRSVINVSLANIKEITQSAERTFEVQFGKSGQ